MSEQHVKNEECIASNYENCWVDEWGARGFGHEVHPHGFIRDIRSTIRKASGAAPPSEFDGDETVEFTYLDASGTVQTASTKLTYKKYLKADALAKNRFEKARQTGDKCAQPPKILKPASTTDYLYDGPFDCWSQQCTHTTITQPLTCKRKDASGNDAPRIEKNSRAEMASGIDETLFSFALVTKKVSAINGKKEVFGHLPGMANMKSCKLSIDGLVDKDGVAMCQNINFGPPGSNEIDIKKPNCEYPELMSLADEFSNTLEKMSNGKVSTDASILMPYIGSDAWGSCSFLINQALLFEDKKKEITTKGCPHEWDETEGSPWQVDPCCNWMLGDSMCCSPRVVEVDVPEASVDTDKLAEYCANDVTQLTMAIFASKAFVEAKAESVDPTYGCVGQRQKDLKKYESLGSAAEDCAGEVVGEHQNDGKSKSTKECTTDADCYSGTCKEAEGGGGSSTRTCQTSNLPEHMAACLLDKFSSTPKAAAILKDVTTNGNIKANAYQVGQGLAALAGREMCIGPEGWNYDPEWPTCKYGTDEDGNWFDMWNWETGQCDEYFCQGRDDCKSKCLATNPVCNTDPWNSGITQEQCESDELGGNFCAMCWSGDQDCYEVSEPTVCRIDRHGNQWEGQFTEESCKALMGEKGTVVTQTYEWSGDETTCTLPGVSTQEECVNVDNICEEIGFTDEWGCMTEKDVNDCWGDMPSSARPEYNPISGNETCHCDDINDEWCYCNARWHEHWIEYKKHHWKPMCTWEVKFKTEEEARSFCPEVPGMEVTLISTKEKRCKYEQLCFTKDLELDVTSLYPEWEWDCMNPNWGSTCAQTHLNHGAGDEGWMQLITKDDLDNFKDCVDNNEHDWCTYSDNFEEKFNTIYQCVDTGVCDGTDANACDALRGQASAYQAKFNELGGNQYWPPHVWWQEDLGICRIQFDSWDLGGMTAAAQTCDYYNFTWKSSKFFEAGRFDTEEKCTAGVCDQDPGGWMGLTEEECVQTASCSNWNCLGCERNNWEAPDSVCWIPTTSDGEAMTETLCGHQNYTGTWKEFTGDGQTFHACVKDENQGPENCKFTYAKCDGMKTEQCGGGDGWMSAGAGVFDNAVTQHLLTCQPSAWSECKSKTECEAVGECWGGMRRHYCYNGECGIWTNVCIAPKVADEWGWESCDSYGSWHEGVEWIETGCIILSKSSEADCDEIGGTWTSTEETEETCLATKKCSQSQGWFNNMDETECDKCDNSWESTNQWWGNTWNIGKMRSMYKWKERKYEPKTDWISELDSWRVREVIKEIVNALNEEVEGAFAKCMYSPLIDSLEKIACVCGKDRGSCDIDGIFGAGTSLVNTTAYTGAAETAGKHSGTRVEIGSDSVNTSATVEMTSQIFIPPVSNSTGSSDYGSEASTTLGTSRKLLKNMYRRLTGEEEEESSLNSAGCATVVKNSAGFFVGQMVGDCVTLSISEDGEAGSFVDPARMCINTKSAIERAPEYTIAGVGIAVGTTHYRIKDVGVVEVNGEQFCFDVTEGMEACPIMHAPNPEDAEADVTEGKCGLVEELVTTVVMKQGCKMGDRKSCAWLEEGSLSRAAAMATGVLLLIIIVATLVSSCCGAWLHPKSRAVMLKHLNKEYYNSIDKDGDGLLDKNEIRAMLDKEFGEKISDAELDKLFDQFDHDHNGQLDFEEYKKMMNAHKINGGPSRNMQGGSDK
uniref:EF-hand domain-containing protein n=1 Tax=Triparma pacifica TaxID=91992 RepID=A0A7S2QUM1_9STRA